MVLLVGGYREAGQYFPIHLTLPRLVGVIGCSTMAGIVSEKSCVFAGIRSCCIVVFSLVVG